MARRRLAFKHLIYVMPIIVNECALQAAMQTGMFNPSAFAAHMQKCKDRKAKEQQQRKPNRPAKTTVPCD